MFICKFYNLGVILHFLLTFKVYQAITFEPIFIFTQL